MKMEFFTYSVFFSVCLSALPCIVSWDVKECTNIPNQLSSHTMQYQLYKTNNLSWIDEMYEKYHLNPTEDSTWSSLRPHNIMGDDGREEFNWAMFFRGIKYSFTNGTEKFLKEVSLHDVQLDPDSKHGRAQQTNLEYLLMLDPDRLVWSFRKTAGVLDPPGIPFGGWEDPGCQLRGHFVGHYMSASAIMWASTHNITLYEKMSAVVKALEECQNKMGTGYLSAFPSDEFELLEALHYVWAPYYTIHKIMAGLLDQYQLAGKTQALKMVTWMADYFGNRVAKVISQYTIERHWKIINTESGGMNDVFYRLYGITGDLKYLVLGHLFDKPCFIGLLAMQADSLSGFHSNTHIPVVVGTQTNYEVTGDPLYKALGTRFIDYINSSHTYATGGSNLNEHWEDPKRLATTLQTENEESCTTYNTLKVIRTLFRWTKEMAYADHYERALTNATESFSKLGDSIYFEEEADIPGLYIIQYISSSLNWRSGKLMIMQKIEPIFSSDPRLQVSLTISTTQEVSQQSKLYLRIPFWTNPRGSNATLKNQSLPLPLPGNFMTITRNWGSNDTLTLKLPIDLRLEKIKDDRPQYADVQAILFGPFLLAGLSNGDWGIRTGPYKSLSDWIIPIPPSLNSQLFTLAHEFGNKFSVLTKSNVSFTMEELPEAGTESAVNATFRLITEDTSLSQVSSLKDPIGKSVMLEPFDLPGMALAYQGPDKNLVVTKSGGKPNSGVHDTFRVVTGLDKKNNTYSLESEIYRGCFLFGMEDIVELRCMPKSTSELDRFYSAVSFRFIKGRSEYPPITFMAKGLNRNFVLVPLLGLTDESYTAYFRISP
ncbi:hypothetical protein AAC387_Pa03g3935 [Persea americana]